MAVELDVGGGGVEVRTTGVNGREGIYRGRLLIDASGRDTFLGSRMRTKEPHTGLDRAALSTHSLGARYEDGIEEGLLQIVYLGGEKQGWVWAIPVGTDRVSVGVVLSHACLGGNAIDSDGMAARAGEWTSTSRSSSPPRSSPRCWLTLARSSRSCSTGSTPTP